MRLLLSLVAGKSILSMQGLAAFIKFRLNRNCLRLLKGLNGQETPHWKPYAGLPRLIFLTLNRTTNSLPFVILKNTHSMREGLFQTRDWIFQCMTMIITLQKSMYSIQMRSILYIKDAIHTLSVL